MRVPEQSRGQLPDQVDVDVPVGRVQEVALAAGDVDREGRLVEEGARVAAGKAVEGGFVVGEGDGIAIRVAFQCGLEGSGYRGWGAERRGV